MDKVAVEKCTKLKYNNISILFIMENTYNLALKLD